jgi:small multidrug resistance pump
MGYVYLSIAIIAEVIATTAMTSSRGFTKLAPSLITITGYAIAFYLLAQTLKLIPTGIAYAIWSGVGIILIALLAWFVHGQKPDVAAVIGMALIVAGVVVMNTFSKMSAH